MVLADRTAVLSPPGTVRALLIPAEQDEPPMLIDVESRSASISAALGGGLLADPLTGSTPDGTRYCLYRLDTVPEVPENVRATSLAIRLGHLLLLDQARLRGAVLITGLHPGSDDDLDVPRYIPELLS